MKKLLGTAARSLVLAMAPGFDGPAVADATPLDASIVRDPTEVPAPIIRSAPATVKIELEAVERVAELNDGRTYRFWTFHNQVPGPLTRVRVGHTVELTLTNADPQSVVVGESVSGRVTPGGARIQEKKTT